MFLDRLIKRFLYSLLYYFSKRDSRITIYVIYFFRIASKTFRSHYLLPMKWLDTTTSRNSILLKNSEKGHSYCPKSIKGEITIKEVSFPNINYYKFRNSRINSNSSSVIIDDGIVFIERINSSDQDKFNYSSGQIRNHGLSSAIVQLGDAEHIEEGIFLGGNGSSNYYHWLVEILPKFQFIPLLPDAIAKYPLLVNEDIENIPTLKEVLKYFSSNHELIYLKNNRSYIVKKLAYIESPSNLPFNLREKVRYKCSYTWIREDSVYYIRNLILKNLDDATYTPINTKRVFLCRKNVRRNYNQDEVFSLLQKHDFVKVYMEDLGFISQVQLMQQAEWIVGPTGAAWTNLIFCRKEAKCLCWMAEEYAEFSAYSTIARIIGVDLRYIYYKAGVTSTSDLYRKEYNIDVDFIKAGLYELGIEESSETVPYSY